MNLRQPLPDAPDTLVDALLAAPEAREIRARIDANTCPLYPLRDEYVKQITLVVLRAKGMA